MPEQLKPKRAMRLPHLTGALQSGNLSSAKSAFSDLRQLLIGAGSIGAANSLKSDFDALGKALGSGDVCTARQDLAQVKTDAQSALQSQMPRKSSGHNLQRLLSTGRTLAGLV
jgi:hypothetical protein